MPGSRSFFRHASLRGLVTAFILNGMIAPAAPPAWWSYGSPPVIDAAAAPAPDANHGVANIGQAKWVAKNALEALRLTLPGLAAQVEAGLVGSGKPIASWAIPVTQPEKDAQRAPLLLGQLKAIAAPFYQQLATVAPEWVAAAFLRNGMPATGTYPWSTDPADDANRAPATIGQLKAVFALDFLADYETGADADDLSDLWEQAVVNASATDGFTDISQINRGNAAAALLDSGYTEPVPPKADDLDGDGLSDAWEKERAAQLLTYGLTLTQAQTDRLNLGDLLPGEDLTGEGITNVQQHEVYQQTSGSATDPAASFTFMETTRDSHGAANTETGGAASGGFWWWGTGRFVEEQYLEDDWAGTSPQQILDDLDYFVPWEETTEERADVEWLSARSFYDTSGPTGIHNFRTWSYVYQEHRVRLIFRAPSPVARTVTFFRVKHTNSYPNYLEVDEITTELVHLTVPANKTTSNVCTLSSPLVDHMDTSVRLELVGITGDTDHNGTADKADLSGADQWTKKRGAIYSVNFDRDGGQTHNNLPRPDAILWGPTPGNALAEDSIIENEEDEKDIAPLTLFIPTLPTGSKVFLTAPEQEDVRAIHVYPKIAKDTTGIWGNYSVAGSQEVEITNYLRNEGSTAPVGTVIGGQYTFGVEGLLFKGMKISNLTSPFSGVVDISLAIELPGQARQTFGTAKLKVAPWLLAPNDAGATKKVFVAGGTDSLAGKGINHEAVVTQGLPVRPAPSGQPQSGPSWWMQDHVEIGYTQRPGGPVTAVTLLCPYDSVLAEWPLSQLCEPDKGVFTLGADLLGGQGDYGGDIELTHPTSTLTLGKIIGGSKMSAAMRSFLQAQEVQGFEEVDTTYVHVTHVDEIVSTGTDKITYYSDPERAIQLLSQKFPTAQSRLEGVFFSTDATRAKVTTAFAATPGASTRYLITSEDYASGATGWAPYAQGYVRLVGPSGGQVARISGISAAAAGDSPVPGVAGKLKLTVSQIWNTGDSPSRDWTREGGAIPSAATWASVPQAGVSLVCVVGSKLWATGCPALMTVGEVLDDTPFSAFNDTVLPAKIEGSLQQVNASRLVGVPSLYFRSEAYGNTGCGRSWTSIAYTPGAVNCQWSDGVPSVPKPFGPRDANDNDVFETALSEAFGGPVHFVDDWEAFHVNSGEVHCGSAAERTPKPDWWKK